MTFRERPEDLEIINALIIRSGGIDKSEVLRRALRHYHDHTQAVIIVPKLAPRSDLETTRKIVREFVDPLRTAIRTGWPDHIPSESEKRRELVILAREKFEIALAKLKPQQDSLELLIRGVAVIENWDVSKLQAATKTLATYQNYAKKHEEDMSLPEKKRKDWTKVERELGEIMSFLAALGVEPRKYPGSDYAHKVTAS